MLQELLKRLQDRHVDCAEAVAKKGGADSASTATVDPDAPNVLQAMMLFQQAKKNAQATQDRTKAAQDQVKATKKVALESEKDNDAAQKELQELQRVMEPKRARTNATTVNDHEECDEQLALRDTTVCESTSTGVSLVLWYAGVDMTVSHVISFWMFLGVCARSSLSGRKNSSPCYRFKV
jgi:hypothetical protein